MLQGLIEGKPAEGTPIICDVRDVAAAHVAAAERPAASGRYIVSQRAPITPSFVSEVLRVSRSLASPRVPCCVMLRGTLQRLRGGLRICIYGSRAWARRRADPMRP